MKRRQFFRRTIPVLPFVLGGLPVRVFGRSPLLDALAGVAAETDRVLVLVQLNGGNDGLNTVIPLDQYSALSTARGALLIPEPDVLKLADSTGLHPAMAGLRSLYDNGRLRVIQGVGYPRPNFSHFRATDIWLTASDSGQVLNTGWLGRYLEGEYPGYPSGYPTPTVPHPIAIQIGSVVSPGLHGPDGPTGIAVANPGTTFSLPGGFDIPPDSPAGHELTFIRQVAEQTQVYSTVVRAASNAVTNLSPLYPPSGQNSLADQMKIAARLIAGGLQTRIYVVNLGGFDTHASQVVSGAPQTGTHATLLGRLSQAITAFQDDLRLLGLEQRVLGMTFSEFGRRIKANASLGTDHGTAAPILVFGAPVQPGISGTNPVIPANATNSDNLQMQYDFRSVYASILSQWLGASTADLQAVLLRDFDTLPIVRYALSATTSTDTPREFALLQNFPNPFNPWTTIGIETPEAVTVRLVVYDTAGREVRVLADGPMQAGRTFIDFDGRGLASGVYFYRVQAGSYSDTRKMILMR